jgi:cell division protein FtsB
MPRATAANTDSRPSGWNTVGFAAATIAYVLVFGCIVLPLYPRYRNYQALEVEAAALVQERDKLKKRQKRRLEELTLLEHHGPFVEMKARDTLDLARPNEVVFRFDAPLTNP